MGAAVMQWICPFPCSGKKSFCRDLKSHVIFIFSISQHNSQRGTKVIIARVKLWGSYLLEFHKSTEDEQGAKIFCKHTGALFFFFNVSGPNMFDEIKERNGIISVYIFIFMSEVLKNQILITSPLTNCYWVLCVWDQVNSDRRDKVCVCV